MGEDTLTRMPLALTSLRLFHSPPSHLSLDLLSPPSILPNHLLCSPSCCCQNYCPSPWIRRQAPRCNPHCSPPSWYRLRFPPHQPCRCSRNRRINNHYFENGNKRRMDFKKSLALLQHRTETWR